MARKSRKQTAAPMPAPSLYVHVALYIRLSVEDNKKRGCSVENQKLVLNDFLSDKPDFVVYDTYIDNGATGTNFHRPGFQQMLSDIEAGHINCVIVKDLSRLGRNSIDTGYYIEQYFHAHNVRFIAVTDQFDTADSGNLHGGIMLPLKNMINEAYALDIGRKIKAQARQAMKDGDYIGARAPYGYRKDPDNCHKLLIDENTAPVVKQIFEWAHEHVALNRIVRNLEEAVQRIFIQPRRKVFCGISRRRQIFCPFVFRVSAFPQFRKEILKMLRDLCRGFRLDLEVIRCLGCHLFAQSSGFQLILARKVKF